MTTSDMTEQIENPPAFPVEADFYQSNGMTLRDYFAAKAIALFPLTEADLVKLGSGVAEPNHKYVAKFCYSLADAMLAERAANQSKQDSSLQKVLTRAEQICVEGEKKEGGKV